jgi:uncharacterized protein YcfJ
MKRCLCFLLSGVLASGCATVDKTYRPIVDLTGVDPAKYESDLADCRMFAKQTLDAEQTAVAGAVAGALLGVAIGAVFGLSGRDLSQIAGASAVAGAAGGAGQGYQNQTTIVKNCLLHRGYKVLG